MSENTTTSENTHQQLTAEEAPGEAETTACAWDGGIDGDKVLKSISATRITSLMTKLSSYWTPFC